MKRPNKIERMNAYLYAWAILKGKIENPYSAQSSICVCPMLAFYYKNTIGNIDTYKSIPFLYPEFGQQKPQNRLIHWWGDNNSRSRIKALENAIKLLA